MGHERIELERAREEEKREGDKRRPRGQRVPREDQESRQCVTKMAGFHKKREAGGREAKKASGAEMFRVGDRAGVRSAEKPGLSNRYPQRASRLVSA